MYERVVKNAKAFRLTDALMVATSNLLELIFVVCEYLPALTSWKWGKGHVGILVAITLVNIYKIMLT